MWAYRTLNKAGVMKHSEAKIRPSAALKSTERELWAVTLGLPPWWINISFPTVPSYRPPAEQRVFVYILKASRLPFRLPRQTGNQLPSNNEQLAAAVILCMDAEQETFMSGVTNASIGDDKKPQRVSKSGTPAAALVDAIYDEDVELCRQLLDKSPELANTEASHVLEIPKYDWPWGLTSLGPPYQVVRPIVFACLIPRFKEKCRDRRVFSPANLDILRLLVEHGARLETFEGRDVWISYILMEVCWDYDSPEVLQLLISVGADVYTRQLDDWNRTLLQIAATRGSAKSVSFLLDRGVPMNYSWGARGGSGEDGIDGTPLHGAAAQARNEVVRLLLERGAMEDIEKKDMRGETPLLRAARQVSWPFHGKCPSPKEQREETIRILVDAGANIQAEGETTGWYSSETVLGRAVNWAGADILHFLAGQGADIRDRRSYAKNSFHSYRAGGDMVTPLHQAAHAWNAAGVQGLLTLGADPTAEDQWSRQPLHWAAMGNYVFDKYMNSEYMSSESASCSWADGLLGPEVAELLSMQDTTLRHLLFFQAPVNQQDKFGRTALHYAARLKLIGAVKLLLGHSTDLGLFDEEGQTALHELAHPLLSPNYKDLLDKGLDDEELGSLLSQHLKSVDIDRRDKAGNTALHNAARAASDTAVALLLRLGADPNLPDGEGFPPLHLAATRATWVYLGTYELEEYAAWANRAARIRALLLAAGADSGLRDRKGRTAGEIEEAGREEIRVGRAKYQEIMQEKMLARAAFESQGSRALRNGRGRGRPPG